MKVCSSKILLATLWLKKTFRFLYSLFQADLYRALSWFLLITLSGITPVMFVIFFGMLIGGSLHTESGWQILLIGGTLFSLISTLPPLLNETSEDLGDSVVQFYNNRIMQVLNSDKGLQLIEDPATTIDIITARDFDLALSGPPLGIAMRFIAVGISRWINGLGMILILCTFHIWAGALLFITWLSSVWLLENASKQKESSAKEHAQIESHYLYNIAVGNSAAKEIRVFGIENWIIDRFYLSRLLLMKLRQESTKMRLQPLLVITLLLIISYIIVFNALSSETAVGTISFGNFLTLSLAALGTSSLSFSDLNWMLSSCKEVSNALYRIEERSKKYKTFKGTTPIPNTFSYYEKFQLKLENVTLTYPNSQTPAVSNISFELNSGSSLAIVGANGAGKTTIAKIIAGLYMPTSGSIQMNGVELSSANIDDWRSHISVVFQDFVRYDLSVRANVAPFGGTDTDIIKVLREVGIEELHNLDQELGSGYDKSRNLSGGQWQRIAIARALYSIAHFGTKLIILDEPTAQLDVYGEKVVFNNILKASSECATILISHRFATVRRVDKICVINEGHITEFGSHDELMSFDSLYRKMFMSQAERFFEQ